MLVIINALKSIARSKGRNILIGIIVLTIAVSSCIALAIRSAASKAEDAGLDLVNITASISVDRQKLAQSMQNGASSGGNKGQPDMEGMRELMSQYQDLSLEELQTYAQSDFVKNFYYTASISLDASGDLEPYSTESSDTSNNGDSGNAAPETQGPGGQDMRGGPGGGGGMMIFNGRAMGDFSLTGYSAEDAMTKFVSGTSTITDGAMFDTASADLNCLISNELAAFNGLKVGDKITLANPSVEEETYTFTVSGIYTDASSSTETGGQMRFGTSQDPANLICISYGALKSIVDHSVSASTTTTDDNGNERETKLTSQVLGTYVFGNKEDYANFGAELTTKGLSEYYALSSSDVNNYEASLVPLQNLSKFASTLLLIILGIGAVILIVINVFNIRERKYEVGVLTAIGIKKGKVAMQFVTELLCITLIAIVLGSGIGAVASVPVSNSLLASQVEQQESESQTQNQNFGRTTIQGGGPRGQAPSMMIGGSGNIGNMGPVDYLDQINATTDVSILLELIAIGVVLTIISSLAAVVFVLRYEPLKILANRT